MFPQISKTGFLAPITPQTRLPHDTPTLSPKLLKESLLMSSSFWRMAMAKSMRAQRCSGLSVLRQSWKKIIERIKTKKSPRFLQTTSKTKYKKCPRFYKNHFKTKQKWSQRFFQITSNARQDISKILYYFKKQTTRVPKILFIYFKNKTKGVP